MSEDESTSFLLSELELIEKENQRLRTEGVARLNFLVAIVSGVLGGLFTLSSLGQFTIRQIIGALALASLLLFILSIGTYEYTIGRDISSDRNARATGRIRNYFIKRHPQIAKHVTWQTDDSPTNWVKKNKSNVRTTILFICTGLAAVSVGLSFYYCSEVLFWSLVSAIVTSGLVGITLMVWATVRLGKAKKRAVVEQRCSKAIIDHPAE